MSNYMQDLIDAVGYPPHKGRDPSHFSCTPVQKIAYKNWYLAQGFNSTAVSKMSSNRLIAGYQERAYFLKMATDVTNMGGSASARVNNIKIDLDAGFGAVGALPNWAEDTRREKDDFLEPPQRKTPDIRSEPDRPASASASAPNLSEADLLNRIAIAAGKVIPKKVEEAKQELRAEIDTKIANTKLELSDTAKEKFKSLATDTARACFEEWLPPRKVIYEDAKTHEVRDIGVQHSCFEKLLRACSARNSDGYRLNIWLTGPAGSGKTTAAANIAKLFGFNFAFESSLDADYKVTGFVDANGNIVSTKFIEIYRDGGIFLADEIDCWQASATVALNGALANGLISTPGGMIARHKDCIVLAAANTWGLGATNEYVGRNKLDAATLDRFQPKIDWPIDEKLELTVAEAVYGSLGVEWCKTVQLYRRKAKNQGLHVLITPRATYSGIGLLQVGFKTDEVINMTFAAGLKPDQRAALNLSSYAEAAE